MNTSTSYLTNKEMLFKKKICLKTLIRIIVDIICILFSIAGLFFIIYLIRNNLYILIDYLSIEWLVTIVIGYILLKMYSIFNIVIEIISLSGILYYHKYIGKE